MTPAIFLEQQTMIQPERLNHLVLSNTGAKIGTEDAWNARIAAVQNSGMKSVALAVLERWFTPAYRQKEPETMARILKMLEETNPEGYASCCAAVRDFDCREQLARIPTPTLVIAGAHDPVCLATLALGANEFQVEHGRSPMSWNYIQYWSENLCKIHHLARLTHHKISQMRTPYLTATISPRLPPARY